MNDFVNGMYNSAENSSTINLHLAWGLYYKQIYVYLGFIVVLLVYEIN